MQIDAMRSFHFVDFLIGEVARISIVIAIPIFFSIVYSPHMSSGRNIVVFKDNIDPIILISINLGPIACRPVPDTSSPHHHLTTASHYLRITRFGKMITITIRQSRESSSPGNTQRMSAVVIGLL